MVLWRAHRCCDGCFQEPLPEAGGAPLDRDSPALPKGVHVFDQGAVWLGKVVPVLPIKVATEAFQALFVAVGQQDAWRGEEEQSWEGPRGSSSPTLDRSRQMGVQPLLKTLQCWSSHNF